MNLFILLWRFSISYGISSFKHVSSCEQRFEAVRQQPGEDGGWTVTCWPRPTKELCGCEVREDTWQSRAAQHSRETQTFQWVSSSCYYLSSLKLYFTREIKVECVYFQHTSSKGVCVFLQGVWRGWRLNSGKKSQDTPVCRTWSQTLTLPQR